MRYLIFIIFLGLCMFSCIEDDACKESAVTAINCNDIYLPVCGCNGKNYGNACYAESHGIMVIKLVNVNDDKLSSILYNPIPQSSSLAMLNPKASGCRL